MPEISDQDYRTFVRLQDIAAKYDGPDGITKKIGKLETDNADYRTQIKDLDDKVPKDGQVVVAKDDADALEKYRALGKPEDLTAAVGERDTLKAEAAERARKDTLRKAGKAAFGSDTAGDVLDRVKGSENWTIEFRDEGEGDKKTSVAWVTVAEGQSPVKLAEYAAAELPEILPALKVEQPAPQPQGGTQFVKQAPNGAPPKTQRTEEEFRSAVEQTANYTL